MTENVNGFGIIESMVGLAILSMGVYGLAVLSDHISKESLRGRKLPTMLAIESSMGLAIDNPANYTVSINPPDFTNFKLVGADGITYGDRTKDLFFTPDGTPCLTVPLGKYCIVRTRIDVAPVGSEYGISYRITDVSQPDQGLAVVPLGDLTKFRWIIPSEYYKPDGDTNCSVQSIFLRGFSPQTGKPICWNQANTCAEGQIAKSVTFGDPLNNNDKTFSFSATDCVTLRTATCLPDYALQTLLPKNLDPAVGGSPGTCAYIFKQTTPAVSGNCPGNYTITGGSCILNAGVNTQPAGWQ